jgi:CDP-diacylglycerol---glycerol-3-phosphate 3-phosphatidyltransferase
MAVVSRPPRPPVFNLPNQLTGARFVLSLVLFALIAYQQWIACIAVFAVAAFTDWLDGYIARKQGITSTLGRNLDPLVDKVLICGAFTFLIPEKDANVQPWMVTVVVARELIITGLRGFMENLGATFGADWLGKLKMGLQCAALIAIFVALEKPEIVYLQIVPAVVDWTRDLLIYAMLAATALSGTQYLWRAFALLKKANL